MPQRFDDIFTQTHAGDGVNVFEFDSRTAPSHPDKMTWEQAVRIIGLVVLDSTDNDNREKIFEAWATILRGV